MSARETARRAPGGGIGNRLTAENSVQAALAQMPRSWRLVPISSDKRPLLRGWPERATNDPAVIRGWLRRWPRCALALRCGPESGVLALDIDAQGETHAADGFAALAELEGELGPLPATTTAITPSAGRHLFFSWPAGIERIPSRPLVSGLDIKGSSGLVTLPTGPRTPRRRWLRPPREGPAELPARWRARLVPPPPKPPVCAPRHYSSAYVRAALERAAGEVATARPGMRNAALNREAFALARIVQSGELDVQTVAELLAAAALRAGLPTPEIKATIRSGLRAGGAT